MELGDMETGQISSECGQAVKILVSEPLSKSADNSLFSTKRLEIEDPKVGKSISLFTRNCNFEQLLNL